MKNFITLIVLLVTFMIFGCRPQKMTPENITKEKEAIKTVLDNYIVSIENEDIELYSRIFVHDPDMVNFGTGEKERIVGWESLKKVIEDQNAALSGTKITQSDVTINLSPDGEFAWATSLWDFNAKMDTTSMRLPVRCSWILEKTGNEWRFIHFHKSVGAAW
jgi:ketosteroid isomerase-like protein